MNCRAGDIAYIVPRLAGATFASELDRALWRAIAGHVIEIIDERQVYPTVRWRIVPLRITHIEGGRMLQTTILDIGDEHLRPIAGASRGAELLTGEE